MNNYMDNDTFEFGSSNNQNGFDYNSINGLGESDYQNEDLFDVETSNTEELEPVNSETLNQFDSNNEVVNAFSEIENEQTAESFQEETPFYSGSLQPETNEDINNDFQVNFADVDENDEYQAEVEFKESEEKVESSVDLTEPKLQSIIDTEFLDDSNYFSDNSLDNDYVLPVEEPTIVQNQEPIEEEKQTKELNVLSETPIEDLNKLTQYNEEKIQTTDIKALFDRVGVNVKEASDIFKKNTEMKEKIDSRFEELKKLQSEVEKSKQSQYDEINSYKEEVLLKLTEKKEEIERRLNKLRDFQASLEKEKQEFEQYRKKEKEEIEKVQKEIQEAYEGRREELNHIEDVLRKQKDALDDERAQLSLDRIQYESDKNELANNLLKFNEIVDTFTNGVDKLNN